MTLVIFLGLLLLTSIAPTILHNRDRLLITGSQLILIALIIATIGYAFYQQSTTYSWQLLQFNHINLTLSIQWDRLAKIMTTFILVIGFFIYRYAQNYLESDPTRVRFLSQLNLVFCSVLALVMAANLLTAFVAWQLIGINLYLLLNHYHDDPAANRAAKKKFVINRIGDCSFLLAILLAFHTHSAASFVTLQQSVHAELICGLIFISVMTKCAQFPFHVWLMDTMETPTPVSALMHAGVINAGGILLTRISATLVGFQNLTYLILLIGLISAVLSIHWMNQQPDTKKKLAYSTMGQMGYMLTQCSLGAFPAAIFHLMSHGFYKASLFLNAGETIHNNRPEIFRPANFYLIIKSLVIALVIFFAGIALFKKYDTHIPLLMYGFILLTLITLVLKTNKLVIPSISQQLIYYVMIAVLYFAYLYCFHLFSQLLPGYEHTQTISITVQTVIFIALCVWQAGLWLGKINIQYINFNDGTEAFLRRFILTPLRQAGNLFNQKPYQRSTSLLYIILMIVTIACFFYGIFYQGRLPKSYSLIDQWFLFLFLAIGIIALIIANRCLSIKGLIIYLALFELAFINLAWFDGDYYIAKIGLFHLINVCTVLIMLSLLARKKSVVSHIDTYSNRLPTRVFYLTFGLLLLIGIPGTASFISEFYLLNALLNDSIILILMYVGLIILLAIVVMHSLQLYAFNKNYVTLLSSPIRKIDHWIFLIVIALNIICGIHPSFLLSHL